MDFGKRGNQMGGAGSGRRKSRERDIIEDCDSLDISLILRWEETFFPVYAYIDHKNGKKTLCIDYSFDWMAQPINRIERFDLAHSIPGFGGKRYWVVCNNCGRKVKRLYRPASQVYFRCRVCHDLIFYSQKAKVYDSWLKKISKANGMSPRKYEKAGLVWRHF